MSTGNGKVMFGTRRTSELTAKTPVKPEVTKRISHPQITCPELPLDKTSEIGMDIYTAAAKNDLTVLQSSIDNLTADEKKAIINWKNGKNFGRTALMIAAKNGNIPAMKFLTQEKATDVFIHDDHELGSTAIHLATEFGRVDAVCFLADFNSNLIDIKNKVDSTPLNIAAFQGFIKIVEYLVEDKKANIENKGSFNRTPLMSAAEMGHDKIVEFLLSHGAIVDSKSNAEGNGDMAIHLAAYFGHLEVIRLLLERDGKLLEAKNNTNETPLNRAAIGGQLAVVQYLAGDLKANLENCGELGRTPLLQAADEGQAAVVDLLIDLGANVEAKDRENADNALHLAAYFDHNKVVEILLRKGGKRLVHSINKQGATAFEIAKQKNNIETLAVMKNHGIKC